jgi:uncharacterized membrane protein HdeD (DUF308 family)
MNHPDLGHAVRHVINVLWWTLLVRGLAAIAFGLVAVFWPGPTLIVLVFLFSAFIIASGVMNVVFALAGRRWSNMWLFILILGILEIGVGIYAVRNPAISLAAFILLVGFTLLFRGLLQIIAAFMETTPDGASKALLALSGVLSGVAGIYIVLQPDTGGLAFVWALGLYALIAGSMDIARAITARNLLEIPVHDRPRTA